MKRFLYGLALAIGLAGCTAFEQSDPREAVVRIEMAGGVCTGFYINHGGMIATAGHCVTKGDKVKVYHKDGSVRDATVVADDDSQDVALIVLDIAERVKYIPLRCDADLRVGDYVKVIGHPRDIFKWFVSFGHVSGSGKVEGAPDPNIEYIWLQAPILPGNSGGPVINSWGEAVGVISIGMASVFNGAVHIKHICKLVG